MNTTDNQIKVLQAFKEGKAVEVMCEDGTWKEIEEEVADFYPFNFATETYRVKPKLRPYQTEREFIGAYISHGGLLSENTGGHGIVTLRSMYGTKAIYLSSCDSSDDAARSFHDIFCHYKWADDGTPCGVEEE